MEQYSQNHLQEHVPAKGTLFLNSTFVRKSKFRVAVFFTTDKLPGKQLITEMQTADLLDQPFTKTTALMDIIFTGGLVKKQQRLMGNI